MICMKADAVTQGDAWDRLASNSSTPTSSRVRLPFRRFSPADPDALESEIARARLDLKLAVDAGDTVRALDLAGTLAGMLTAARSEEEAYEIAHEHLDVARRQPSWLESGWLLHALATAAQYTGRRTEANSLFSEALELCREHGWQELEHFVLHHWGRSLVEEGEFDRAEAAFREALAIRQERRDSRAASTASALVDLQRLREDQ
jgi:tetratricopeptide (TPR) repeat protein